MSVENFNIYCWQLKKPRETEDDHNDLHIAIDAEDVIPALDVFEDANRSEYTLECEPFPDKSPQHMDIGPETFMKNYKSDVIDFEKITVMITYEEDEILLWNNGVEEAFVKLTAKRLQELRKLFLNSRNSAYYYDNVIAATRITDNYDFQPCRIVVWGGFRGQVIYY